MAVTVAAFVERVEACGILGEAELSAVRDRIAPSNADAEAFVKSLVRAELLTPYQAKALWRDKGRKLAFGNYVVEDELGRGGMGVVLKGRHRRMKRHVAIKVLPAKVNGDASVIARFQREVEAAAQLVHPHIVAAHDADEIDGQHYLVMEFVDGRDLSSIVKQHGPLATGQALDYVTQAARGLAYAHERGVIHRDVKPANLLLDGAGVVRILDMGLARFDGAADVGTQAELTGTGTIMGTVDYMSPEQANSTKSADARSDQYSLGITLFYLLTGHAAYEGDSLMSRLLAHAHQPIPNLDAELPGLPAGLRPVFERMVAKRPEDRFPSMADVIETLERCAGETTGAAELVTPAVLATEPATEPATAATTGGLTGFLRSLDDPTDLSDPQTGRAGRSRTATAAPSAGDAPADENTGVSPTTSGTVRTRRLPGTNARVGRARGSLPAWAADRRVLAGGLAAGMLVVVVLALSFRGSGGTPADAGPRTPPSPGAPTIVERPINRSLVFDTENDVVRLPDLVTDGAECTVETWVRPLGTRSGEILRMADGRGGVLAIEREPGFGGFAAFRLRDGELLRTLGGDGFDERWHHVCAVSTADGLTLYVDGRPAWRPAVPENGREGGFDSRLGNTGPDDFWFQGELDEIRVSRGAVYTAAFTPAARLETGPATLALYHCDGDDDEELVDATEQVRHGTIVDVERAPVPGGVQRTEPVPFLPIVGWPVGHVLGVGERRHVAVNSPKFDPGSPYTLEAFVKPRNPRAGQAVLAFGPLSLELHRSLRWGFTVPGETMQCTTLSPAPAAVDRWTHLAGVWDGHDVRLYQNGHLVAAYRATFERPLGSPADGLRIAASGAGLANAFDGEIDEIRLSNVARYEADFTPDARHRPDEQTVVLFHVDEGLGDTLTDASGHGHDARLEGAEWVRIPTLRNLHEKCIASVAVSPDGQFAVAVSDADAGQRYLSVVDLGSDKVVAELRGDKPGSGALGIAFSPDGNTFVVSRHWGRLDFHSLPGLVPLAQLDGHTAYSSDIHWSREGTDLTTVGDDGMVRSWPRAGRVPSRLVVREPALFMAGAVDPEERIVACGFMHADGIAVFSLANSQKLAQLGTEIGRCFELRFHPRDAGQLFSGHRNGEAVLWDVAKAEEMRRFVGHDGNLVSLEMLAAGEFLVTGGGDNTIRIWEVASGLEVHQFRGTKASTLRVAVTPDQRRIVSGGGKVYRDGYRVYSDNVIEFRDVPPIEELRKRARELRQQ